MAVQLSTPCVLALPPGDATSLKTRPTASESLSEEAELVRATSLYDGGQYTACVDAFERLLNPDEPRRLQTSARIEAARVYHAACLIGVGRTTDAERVFRDAILENPQMKAPDSLVFPDAVVELFLRVRESMLDEIRRAEQKRLVQAESRANREQALREQERQRVEQLIAIAERETVVERRNRWIASIPFGAGQFQNQNSTLGWLFLASEGVLAGALAGSLYMQAWYQSRSNQLSLSELNSGKNTAISLQKVSGYGLLGIGLIGIAEAHWSFVPEVRIDRRRPLPDNLKAPHVAPSPTNELGQRLNLTPWVSTGIVGGCISGQF
jgi:hypothetical protein